MKRARIDIPQDKIAEFCRRHHIRKLSLFGSVLRNDFRPGSDIDVLVEFEPGHVPGFLRLNDLERQLSGLAGGHEIDMVTPKFLNHRLRHRILAEAEVQYVEG
ncbi:MAG: nucleotidyltransferase family protein [Pseudomonadota bacterium]